MTASVDEHFDVRPVVIGADSYAATLCRASGRCAHSDRPYTKDHTVAIAGYILLTLSAVLYLYLPLR